MTREVLRCGGYPGLLEPLDNSRTEAGNNVRVFTERSHTDNGVEGIDVYMQTGRIGIYTHRQQFEANRAAHPAGQVGGAGCAEGHVAREGSGSGESDQRATLLIGRNKKMRLPAFCRGSLERSSEFAYLFGVFHVEVAVQCHATHLSLLDGSQDIVGRRLSLEATDNVLSDLLARHGCPF